MDALRKAGDSCGARIRVQATGVPVGLGEPLFDKLDADIAYAMMGLNAVKGVEIGAGFASVAQRGTTHGDSMTPKGFRSNNAGGVLGGISTGQDLEVSIAIKPTSSIISPRESIDIHGHSAEVITKGRHDPCVGIRATPIAEAMLALVVMDHALRHRAQCADVCGWIAAVLLLMFTHTSAMMPMSEAAMAHLVSQEGASMPAATAACGCGARWAFWSRCLRRAPGLSTPAWATFRPGPR
jgi:chorismate synthase